MNIAVFASHGGSDLQAIILYTPPVTPWESEMPEASDPSESRELSKAGLITGVKS